VIDRNQADATTKHYETADEYEADVARMNANGWQIAEKSKDGPAVNPKALLAGGLVGAVISARRFRPMDVTWVRAAPSPVAAEPQSAAPLEVNLNKDAKFRIANYDGGIPVHPQAEPAGTLLFSADKGRWELHWPPQGLVVRKKPYMHFGATRHALDVEPTGPTSCRVTIRDLQDPSITAHFDMPDTPAMVIKSQSDARMKDGAEKAARARTEASRITAARASGQWWAGVKPAKLYPVIRPPSHDKWNLKVTENGIEWGPPIGKVKIPWSAIRNIEIGQVTQRRGKQHGAIGLGPIGLAVVGATALHNHRAAKADTYHAFVVTDGAGRKFQFLTQQPLTPLAQLYEAFRNHGAPAASRPPVSAESSAREPVASPVVGIADELAKLADLHKKGVLSDDEFAAQKAKLLQQ
jgi:hypothetical protein